MDITLAPGPDGTPLAHRPDCPVVQVMREAGEPLLTLFKVKPAMVDLTCVKHHCLDPEEGER